MPAFFPKADIKNFYSFSWCMGMFFLGWKLKLTFYRLFKHNCIDPPHLNYFFFLFFFFSLCAVSENLYSFSSRLGTFLLGGNSESTYYWLNKHGCIDPPHLSYRAKNLIFRSTLPLGGNPLCTEFLGGTLETRSNKLNLKIPANRTHLSCRLKDFVFLHVSPTHDPIVHKLFGGD